MLLEIFFSFLLLVSFPILAQETNLQNISSPSRLLKVSTALGFTVKNLQQQRLGQVDDIVFDLRSGRIKYVLLSTARIWDRQRSEDVAVPSAALRLDRAGDSLVMDADKQLLTSQSDESSRSSEVIREPAGASVEATPEPKRIPATSANEEIAHARQLLGSTLTQKNGQKMGKIQDAAVDLQHNELVYVVVASGGFLGFGETLFAVPSRGITSVTANEFSIDAEGVASKTAAFDKDHWPSHIKGYAPGEYTFYGQTMNEPAGKETRKTPVTSSDQSNSSEDLQLTRLLRKSIVNDPTFSVAAQNITIVTRGHVVTLVGEVKDQREKEAILKVARQIAGTAVDDRLQVHP